MTALVWALLTPILLALLNGFVAERRLRKLNVLGSLVLLVAAITLLIEVVRFGPIVMDFGGWPSPFAIRFMADGLSALMVFMIALVFASVMLLWQKWPSLANQRIALMLVQGLVTSSVAVSLTSDLFNLYVWFELMLISLLGLFVLQHWAHNREAAIKYFTLNMLGTLLMLAAVGLLYGLTGHLSFEVLAQSRQNDALQPQLTIFSGLLVLALLMKIGTFPLFFWLPASYHTLPLPLLALVGGLLTKITVYVLLRLNGFVFDLSALHTALGWLAVMTMLSGVIGAAYHWDLRRILAFHIVSQVGFLLLGIALASQAATVGTMVFLLHNVLVKSNLFLIVGAIWWVTKHYDLRCMGGLYPQYTFLAVLFLINAMALVGVPPTSGFWGKFLILQEAFAQQAFIWAIAALVTGLLTLYSMSKIWLEAFWKPREQAVRCGQTLTSDVSANSTSDKSNHIANHNSNPAIPLGITLPISLLTAGVLAMGFYPEPLIQLLQETVFEMSGE